MFLIMYLIMLNFYYSSVHIPETEEDSKFLYYAFLFCDVLFYKPQKGTKISFSNRVAKVKKQWSI